MSAAIVAFGAVSAMGEGWGAVSVGAPGERARVCIARDDELSRAGLARPHVARAALPVGAGDRATAILLRAARACVAELEGALPAWRGLRIGLALGTSSGGMRTAEAFFEVAGGREASREVALGAVYFAPMTELVRALEIELEPATLVLGACAASTLAIGLGVRWLEADACDLVLAGGFDAVSVFVAAGFEVLRATSAAIPPSPFRVGRDGMALGEGAALLALRPAHLAPASCIRVTGFGASSDAVHLTAPDRTGSGLARAATDALAEAGGPKLDLVSPHGSATPFSDAAEARALEAVLGQGHEVVAHPFKAQIGHTLGASGVLELLACADALTRGVYPAAAGDPQAEIDPDARAVLLELARAGSPRNALKLSAAFGGANAALVLSREGRLPPPRRPADRVHLGRPLHLGMLPPPEEIATRSGVSVERVARADLVARWALAAVGALVARDGAPRDPARTGVIVGTPFATLETNAAFFARIRERGARMAEPRRFPYTSPNASAGEVSAAFGLKGPSFAVGCGLHAGIEALVAATHLVRAGDADAIVVVAADDVGDAVTRVAARMGVAAVAGAVAVLVTSDLAASFAEVVSASSGTGPREREEPTRCGHLALLPLLERAPPREVRAGSHDPSGRAPPATAWARVTLRPRGDVPS